MDNHQKNRVIYLENFLDPALFQTVQQQIMKVLPYGVKKALGFRAATTITRPTLDKYCPLVDELYHDQQLMQKIETHLDIKNLKHAPITDTHAVAVYGYINEGDHFDWHFDKTVYQGTRYNVLIGIREDSSSFLETPEQQIKIAENGVAIYNGDIVRHRVTPVKAGEKRVILALEYYTDANINFFNRFIRKIKDNLIFGN